MFNISDPENWMSRVPGDVRLSKISIPGSHGSLTGMNPNQACKDDATGMFCLTQNMNLMEQLNAGIRFIDLRLQQDKNNPEKFYCMRGNTKLGIELDQAFDIIKKFLKNNEDETVIVSWQEHLAFAIKKWDKFDAAILKHIDSGLIYNKHEIYARGEFQTPFLDFVRGKIFLMNYQKKSEGHYGSKAFDHGANGTVNDIQNPNIIP